MMWRTRWLRIRWRLSIWQAMLLAACISYYFWSLPWVRQSEKQPIEDLDTGDYLKTGKILFDCLTQSLAPPQPCIRQVSASLPSREVAAGLGRWDRKWYQFVLCSCPAVGDLSQRLLAGSLAVPGIGFHATPWSPGYSSTSGIFPWLTIFTF